MVRAGPHRRGASRPGRIKNRAGLGRVPRIADKSCRYDPCVPVHGRKPLMRSLGEFFGHILAGVRAKVPGDSEARTVKRQVHEEERTIDGRPVTLRRTTIEEVVVHAEEKPR